VILVSDNLLGGIHLGNRCLPLSHFMIQTEIWKDVKGYESLYKVSNLGKVYSIRRRGTVGGILAPSPNEDGYLKIKLCQGGMQKPMLVHRIAAIAFLENPLNLPFINHIDTDKTNNNIKNLEWCTPLHNVTHAKNNGLLAPLTGTDHPRTVFKKEEVMSIYKSTKTNAILAIEHNTSVTCIAKIKTGRTWGHLTGKRFNKSYVRLSAEAIQDILSSTLTRAALAKKYNVSWAAINKTIKRMRR
jgi:hypothetical protein